MGAESAIFSVDQGTGTATFLSPFFSGDAGIDASPSGTIYGAWGSTLATYNPLNNTTSSITDNLPDFMTSVSFTPDGRLYALNAAPTGSAQSLYEINPNTGAMISGRFLSGGLGFISGIEFSSNGLLYALGDYL